MGLVYRLSRVYFALRSALATALASPFLRAGLIAAALWIGWTAATRPAAAPDAAASSAMEAAPTLGLGDALTRLIAAGADLSGADLRALAGRDLSGLALPTGTRLARARLSGLTLAGAEFSGADLRGADLAGADFSDARLEGSNLQGADLTGARLSSASLDGATIEGARFARAELSDASVAGAVGAALWDGAWAWADRPPRAAPSGAMIVLCAPPSDGPRPRSRPAHC